MNGGQTMLTFFRVAGSMNGGQTIPTLSAFGVRQR